MDGSNISAYCVHECEAANRTGMRSRRFVFTGHLNGSVQVRSEARMNICDTKTLWHWGGVEGQQRTYTNSKYEEETLSTILICPIRFQLALFPGPCAHFTLASCGPGTFSHG